MKQPVIEIQPQNAELPHLVGDVLAGVGDGAVRADEDLVVLMLLGARVRFEWHHPTALVRTALFVMDHAEAFHLLKRLVPKMEMQYLRLARQRSYLIDSRSIVLRMHSTFRVAT